MAQPAVTRPAHGGVTVLLGAFGASSGVAVGLLAASEDMALADARALAAAGGRTYLEVVAPHEAVGEPVSRLCARHPDLDALLCVALDRAAEVVDALPDVGPRPAVVLVDGVTSPLGDLVLAAHARGYRTASSDGASLYLVAQERVELAPALSAAACADDLDACDAEHGPMATWRRLALDGWADAAANALTARSDEQARGEALEREIAALRATVSWRVTRPLRAVQRLRVLRRAR